MTAAAVTDRPIKSALDVQGASSNTPPLNTQTISIPEENRILIDWLEFTLPDEFRIHDRYLSLKSYLRIDGATFCHAPRGMNGYKKQIIYGKARILMDGSEDMGVHVILSGEAIRQMSADILVLLHWILHHSGKISRIDLALDDVTGKLTLSRVKKAIRARAVTCRARDFRCMQSGSLSTGEVTGETFYFGSAQSRTQYRIYDKAAEQGIEGQWIRCEGQYRQENAHLVAQLIHDAKFDIGPVFCGLLRGYLNFLTPSKTDTNKSRWATAQWWLDLLNGAEKLKLSVIKPAPSMERSLDWFKRQVAPNFAMLLKYYGSDVMQECTKLGWNRLSEEKKRACTIPF